MQQLLSKIYVTTEEPVVKGASVTTEATAIPGAPATTEVQNNSAEAQYNSASASDPVDAEAPAKILIPLEHWPEPIQNEPVLTAASDLQGTSIRLFPGCENMWWKNCVCLPEVGKQNGAFSFDFTQPGKSLLEAPCTRLNVLKQNQQL